MNKFKYFFFSFVFLLTFSILLLVATILIAEKKGFGYKYQYLINYQIKKIQNLNPNTKVFFLGDSSLGYSIDFKKWQLLSGDITLNLALIGDYQFAGTRALFDLITEKNKKIKSIYIIASIDSWRIKDTKDNFIYLKNQNSFFKPFYEIRENFNLYNFINIFRFFIKNEFNKSQYQIISNYDYIEQSGNFYEIYPSKFINFSKSQIYKDKIQDLVKIFSKCTDLKINCIYVHGPLLDELCDKKNIIDFRNEIQNILKKNNIKYLDNQICFPLEHVGDGFAHISPNQRLNYTIKYFNLLK